jgi:hypothetical protein
MDDIARRLADRWAFSPREELEAGYCSRVYVDENRALKVPWRGEEMTSGYKAAWDLSGWWGPEVFEGDEATGAILMARVVPGQDLSRTPEAEALGSRPGSSPSWVACLRKGIRAWTSITAPSALRCSSA